jgi:hypothetical protein
MNAHADAEAVSDSRVERYRRLTQRLGSEAVRGLIDRLQVLALTQPDVLREIEEFLDRGRVPDVRPAPSSRRDSSTDR